MIWRSLFAVIALFSANFANGQEIGLGRVTGSFKAKDGRDRGAINSAFFGDVNSTFANSDTANTQYSFTVEEIISTEGDIFFQVNDNGVILDAIKTARCASLPCTISSYVDPGVVSPRVAFKIVMTGDSALEQFPADEGKHPDHADLETDVLTLMNATLQDPDFNFTESDLNIQSESGETSIQLDVYRNVTTDPSKVSAMSFVDTAEGLMSTELQTRFLANAEPGDTLGDVEVDRCVLRTACLECESSTGDCLSCATDTWGLNCEVPCTCENGGSCGTDSCTCDYPYMGQRCDLVRDCGTNCSTPAQGEPAEHECCTESPRPEWCHEPQYECEVHCCDAPGGPNGWCEFNFCCGCVPDSAD